jgi:hypothetical protein
VVDVGIDATEAGSSYRKQYQLIAQQGEDKFYDAEVEN